MQACKSCHAQGAAGGGDRAGSLRRRRASTTLSVRRVLDLRAPAASAILAKASGQKLHAGGAPWPVGGPAYSRVLAWIQAGARLDGGGRSAPVRPSRPRPRPLRLRRCRAAEGRARNRPRRRTRPRRPSPRRPRRRRSRTRRRREAPARPPPANDFAGAVHPLLVRTCAACHGPVGTAAATRLVLSSDVAADYAKVRPLVDPATPAASLLLTKAAGEMHAGGARPEGGRRGAGAAARVGGGGRARAARRARAGGGDAHDHDGRIGAGPRGAGRRRRRRPPRHRRITPAAAAPACRSG